jgi:hypothetical protein
MMRATALPYTRLIERGLSCPRSGARGIAAARYDDD